MREVASDIESEDEDEDEDDGGDSTRSGSVAAGGASGRALTARQAVLANVVDSSHVSLGASSPQEPSSTRPYDRTPHTAEPPNPRKKKPLTEIEIALKREETARKRRNLTEKKLEDEKASHICLHASMFCCSHLVLHFRLRPSTVYSRSSPAPEASAMRSPLQRTSRVPEKTHQAKGKRKTQLRLLHLHPRCTDGCRVPELSRS